MIPLNVLQQLMIITAEECGELTQRCSKILRRYETISDIEEEQRHQREGRAAAAILRRQGHRRAQLRREVQAGGDGLDEHQARVHQAHDARRQGRGPRPGGDRDVQGQAPRARRRRDERDRLPARERLVERHAAGEQCRAGHEPQSAL